MDKFITALNAAFKAKEQVFKNCGYAPIATIDKFRNQPLNPEQFEYFPLPAIFINRSIQWQKEGKYYTGLMQVEFHIVQDATWPTENFANNIGEGLKQYTFLSLVRSVLDDFESDNTSKLQRLNETPVDADVSIYDMMIYTCNYYEPVPTGKQLIDTAGDNLNIEKQIIESTGE